MILGRNTELVVYDEVGREKLRQKLPNGTRLRVEPGCAGREGPGAGRVGPAHPAGDHRGVGHDRVPGPDRRHLVPRGGRRGHGQDQQGGHRLAPERRARAICGPRSCCRTRTATRSTLPSGSEARYYLPVGAIMSVENGQQGACRRRAGPPAEGGEQDPRHHRRSAAGGRAVRGAPAQGPGDHRRDRGPDRVRQGLQEQAAPAHPAGRTRISSRSST